MENVNAFVSWSGGKDCTLALHRFLRQGQGSVAALVHMCQEDGVYSSSHRVPASLMLAQATQMGMTILQARANRQNYEIRLKQTLQELKATQGVNAGIFGDIYLEAHRQWIERVCGEMGIDALFPLWGMDTREVISEFVQQGFKAMIVALNTQKLPQWWIGRTLDQDFIQDILRIPDADPCAEQGEYHSFVYDGPLFAQAVAFRRAEVYHLNNQVFAPIEPAL